MINVLRPYIIIPDGLQTQCSVCGTSSLRYNAIYFPYTLLGGVSTPQEAVLLYNNANSNLAEFYRTAFFASGTVNNNPAYLGNDIATSVDLHIDWGDGTIQTIPNGVTSSEVKLYQVGHVYTSAPNNITVKLYFTSDSGLYYEVLITSNSANRYNLYNPISETIVDDTNCNYNFRPQIIIEDVIPSQNHRSQIDWTSSNGLNGTTIDNLIDYVYPNNNEMVNIDVGGISTGAVENIIYDIDIDTIISIFPPTYSNFSNVNVNFDLLATCG